MKNGEIKGQYIVPGSPVLVAGVSQADEKPGPWGHSAEAAPAYHPRWGEAEGLLWSRIPSLSFRCEDGEEMRLPIAGTKKRNRARKNFSFWPLNFHLNLNMPQIFTFASVYPWWFDGEWVMPTLRIPHVPTSNERPTIRCRGGENFFPTSSLFQY